MVVTKCFVFVFFILSFIPIIIKVENLLFGVKFVVDRSAIYFIPLFFIFFLLLWENIAVISSNLYESGHFSGRQNKISPLFVLGQYLLNPIFWALALLIIVHNLTLANMEYFYLWKYDSSTKAVMTAIDLSTRSKSHNLLRKYQIGITWILEPSTNYYILNKNMNQITPTTRSGPDGVFDFYYILESDRAKIEKYKLIFLMTLAKSNTLLAQRNEPY